MSAPRIAGYALEALVGRGGMAEVFRAVACEGPFAGQTVALKRLLPALAGDPESAVLFAEEAAITRRLRHPHVVEVLDAGLADGTPFIAMEYVDGRNLRQILSQCAARNIFLPLDFGAHVAHAVGEALAHAHTGRDETGAPLGIVHCDVSPSNVFISRTGEIKLGDFGVALRPDRAQPAQGAAFGKIRYLAPEQLRGRRPTPQTDLFALGAVLFELLTNAPAFPGADVNEVGQRILAGRLRAPSEVRPEVPFALDLIVLRALAPDPAERYPSAEALVRELEQAYDAAVGTDLAIAAVVRGLFGAR
jgi:serine/threonine protein kinase